jgi:hypothetical protein
MDGRVVAVHNVESRIQGLRSWNVKPLWVQGSKVQRADPGIKV